MKFRMAVIFVSLCASTSVAADDPDPNAAKGIVSAYCADCHEVPGFPTGSRSVAFDAPSFRAIASTPDGGARIRGFLRQPHYPMRQFVLSDSDIENLVAFIRAQAGPDR